MTEVKTIPNKEIKLKGVLTSQIQLRGENTSDHYYYAFVKLKGQSVDLPVIFKVEKKSCRYCEAVWEKYSKCGRSDCGYGEEKRIVKPQLKKGDPVELTGHYSNSPQSIRKSFTAYDYSKLAKFKQCLGCKGEFTSESYDYCATCQMPKECVGCKSKFICFTNEDYDYCSNCEVNGSRYIREENILAK